MNLRCRGGEVALCPESGCYVGYSLTVSAETAFWLPEPWMHSSALMTLNNFTWDLPPHTPGPGAWFELSFGGLVLVGAFIGWVLVPRSAAVMPASASGYQGIWCWFLGSVLCLSCHHTSLWAVWPGYSRCFDCDWLLLLVWLWNLPHHRVLLNVSGCHPGTALPILLRYGGAGTVLVGWLFWGPVDMPQILPSCPWKWSWSMWCFAGLSNLSHCKSVFFEGALPCLWKEGESL